MKEKLGFHALFPFPSLLGRSLAAGSEKGLSHVPRRVAFLHYPWWCLGGAVHDAALALKSPTGLQPRVTFSHRISTASKDDVLDSHFTLALFLKCFRTQAETVTT